MLCKTGFKNKIQTTYVCSKRKRPLPRDSKVCMLSRNQDIDMKCMSLTIIDVSNQLDCPQARDRLTKTSIKMRRMLLKALILAKSQLQRGKGLLVE